MAYRFLETVEYRFVGWHRKGVIDPQQSRFQVGWKIVTVQVLSVEDTLDLALGRRQAEETRHQPVFPLAVGDIPS